MGSPRLIEQTQTKMMRRGTRQADQQAGQHGRVEGTYRIERWKLATGVVRSPAHTNHSKSDSCHRAPKRRIILCSGSAGPVRGRCTGPSSSPGPDPSPPPAASAAVHGGSLT